ncbi:MAG: prolipoprotein diacylglyceryl transferase [Oscillospiraceae bacterium]|nr:prolipoprotein diacylglyceryl transferase [Oscillospiraceae bacterium]
MREVAFCFGRVTLYWDTLLIALACAAGFLALWGTYGANGGKKRAFWLLVPLGLVLSLAVARTIFWYCHSEQFSSLAAALVPGSSGGFCLSGVVIGFVLAALLLRLAGIEKDTALLLDCASPALALCLALVRLSSLFSGGCRGKVPITDPRFCRLPFAAAAPGGGEYRFASFFVGALLFLVLFAVLTLLFVRRWGRRGDVFLAFLVLYSAVELVIDSTRNDASYFTFNAFISVAQILGAAAMLGVLVVFSRRSIRSGGPKLHRVLCWVAWFLGAAIAGVSEYLVQRHGNWQLGCYTLMTIGALILVFATFAVYRPVCGEKTE